jgi:hypothetical protein
VTLADLSDGRHVNGVVEPPVALAREPVADLVARGRLDRSRPVVGREVIRAGEPGDVDRFSDHSAGDDRPDAEELGERRPRHLDQSRDLAGALLHLLVQRANISEVLEGDLEADLAHLVVGPQPEQDFFGFSNAELSTQTAGGELDQQAVEPADRLGPQRRQLISPIAEQAQADRGVVEAHRTDPLSVEGGQPD